MVATLATASLVCWSWISIRPLSGRETVDGIAGGGSAGRYGVAFAGHKRSDTHNGFRLAACPLSGGLEIAVRRFLSIDTHEGSKVSNLGRQREGVLLWRRRAEKLTASLAELGPPFARRWNDTPCDWPPAQRIISEIEIEP
jgi:hypothetical protein